jgi:hypothetical protein
MGKLEQKFFDIAGLDVGMNVTNSISYDNGVYAVGTVFIAVNGSYNDFTNISKTSPHLNNGTFNFIAKLTKSGKQIYFKITGGVSIQPIEINYIGAGVLKSSDSAVYVAGIVETDATGLYYDFAMKPRRSSNVNSFMTFVAGLNDYGEQIFYSVVGPFTPLIIVTPVSLYTSRTKYDNYIYVTGCIDINSNGNYVDFNGKQHTNINLSNSTSIFVARFTQFGKQLFFKIAGASGTQSFPIEIKSYNDDVYVTGTLTVSSTNNYIDFEKNEQYSPASSSTIFVAKLTSNGKQKFIKLAGCNVINQISNIGVSLSPSWDGVYITGEIVTNANQTYYDFSGYLQTLSILPSASIIVPFVAKIYCDGHQAFFNIAIGAVGSIASGFSIIVGDGIYATGVITLNNTSSYYDFEQQLTSTLFNPGVSVAYLAKFSFNGHQEFMTLSSGNTLSLSLITENLNYGGGLAIAKKTYNIPIFPVIDYCGVYVVGTITTAMDGSYYDFNMNLRTSNIFGRSALFVAKISPNGKQLAYEVAGPGGGTFTNGNYATFIATNSTVTNINDSDDEGIYVTATLGVQPIGSNNQYYDFNNKTYNLPLGSPTFFALVTKLNYINKW